MASNGESYPTNGLIVAGDDEHTDSMGELAHAILDDVFYNIIHDIVLKTHRDEKIARASSAAIVVEQKAQETDPNNQDDGSTSATKLPHKVETSGALYKDGEVFLKGNPLKTTEEIRCNKCGLPRLLHPTDGNGARKPDPSVEYCKRRPFIEKKGFDIYGQTFQPEGPGRGKKKQPNPLVAQAGSQDSSQTDASKPINFPHAKCHHCNTFLPIKRMNNHMAKCIGGGGRDSSRTALWKIQNGNGNGNGSQNGSTPPGSRNGTPIPGGSSSQSKGKTSPSKRDAEDHDSEESPEKKKKKLIKTKVSLTNLSKTNKLKAPKMAKSASQHSSSNLSFEHRLPASDDEEGDSDGDGEYGTVVVEPKKKAAAAAAASVVSSATSKIKSSKNGAGDKVVRKKWLLGRGGGGTTAKLDNTPVIEPPDKKNSSNGNGSVKKERAASESSQTLSSPN